MAKFIGRRPHNTLLRGAIVTLLVLALWNPLVPIKDERVNFILLLDDSFSMQTKVSREDWTTLKETLATLPEGSQATLIRFAADNVLEIPPTQVNRAFRQQLALLTTPPRQHPLNRSGSNLAAALERALQLSAASTTTPIILLVTDGGETQGDSRPLLHHAQQSTIDIFGFTPHTTDQIKDIAIETVTLPNVASPKTAIPITLQLSGNYPADLIKSVLVDNQVVLSTKLHFNPANNPPHRFWLPLNKPGSHRIAIKIAPEGDQIIENNRYETTLHVEGALPIVYITTTPETPPWITTLQQLDQPLHVMPPAQLERYLQKNGSIATIILDDISAQDLPVETVHHLERRLRREGVGLLVLGGPHSFGAGAYRQSRFEALLPVTAQAREQEPKAAVMFVIDKSGSMANSSQGSSRLAYARQAVVDTARALSNNDLAGLITFDAATEEALPLRSSDHAIDFLENRWNLQPGGGTQLLPALNLAVDRLAQHNFMQRLLVVVTDGFVDDENTVSLEQRLINEKITPIVLAIGTELESPALSRLTKINTGSFLHLSQQAQLPRLMRQQVEERLSPAHLQVSPTLIETPLPFMTTNAQWPAVQGYSITTARKSATVYLKSARGEPLLAAHNLGAARVVVLPAGLNGWSEDWLAWSHWGEFTGGLLQWLKINPGDPNYSIEIVEHAADLEVRLDLLNQVGEWSPGLTPEIQTLNPEENRSMHRMTPVAPGLFSARIPTPTPGEYHLTINSGEHVMQRRYLRNGSAEFTAQIKGQQRVQEWQQEGLLKHWGLLAQSIHNSGTLQSRATRPYSLFTAIILYLLLILMEYRRPLARE